MARKSHWIITAVVLACGTVQAQENPGVLTKPAKIERPRPETFKPPTNSEIKRTDGEISGSGPGNLVRSKSSGPILDKNTNTGNPSTTRAGIEKGPKGPARLPKGEKVNNPTQTEDEVYVGVKRTGGEAAASGPGESFRKKPRGPGRKNARSGSDEGGDVEDLELQR